ncbi:MAG: NUDIX domain-containing protein [Candidatus Methylomirabilales bacterium]
MTIAQTASLGYNRVILKRREVKMRLREKVLTRRVVYAGSYLTTYQYRVRLPDGNATTRDIVRPPDAVAVVPLDGAGNIHLVRQYRPAVGRILYELPAGIIDRGESPARTARRECEEEIGMRPKRLKKLCVAYHATGFSTGCVHIYLATGLIPVRRRPHDGSEFVEPVRLPLDRAYRMALLNQIVDAQSLIGLLWTQRLRAQEAL